MKINFHNCKYAEYEELVNPETLEKHLYFLCKHPKREYGRCRIMSYEDHCKIGAIK